MRKKKALYKEFKILSSQQQSKNTVIRKNIFIINTEQKLRLIT